MLILKNINKNNSYLTIDKVVLRRYLREGYFDRYTKNIQSVTIDVLDTNTGVLHKGVNLSHFKSNLKEVFGVVYTSFTVLFIAINDNTWNLLNYINEPTMSRKYSSLDKFVKTKYKNAKFFAAYIDKYKISIYDNGSKDIIFIKLNSVLLPLDKNRIFWTLGSANYFTIMYFYKLVFGLSTPITENTDVYLMSCNNVFIKLDTNKEVIRFMTKLKVLGEN